MVVSHLRHKFVYSKSVFGRHKSSVYFEVRHERVNQCGIGYVIKYKLIQLYTKVNGCLVRSRIKRVADRVPSNKSSVTIFEFKKLNRGNTLQN